MRLRAPAAAAALLVALSVPLPAPAGPAPASRVPAGTVYLVRAGDTLTAIAGRHGVTIAALVKVNRLPSPRTRLQIGQRLTIPVSVVAATWVRSKTAAAKSWRPPPPPRTLILAVPDFTDLAPLFAWPVDGPVSSMFGRRRMGWHQGIDIKADLRTPVMAAAAGTVVSSGYESRYGQVVKIEHLNGFMTVYAHNDENLVEAGDRVTLGQIIAAAGRTGRATADHVHFEIRQTGLAYNPLYMLPLPPQVTRVEDVDEEDVEDTDD